MKYWEIYKLLKEVKRAIRVANQRNDYIRVAVLKDKKRQLKRKLQIERTRPRIAVPA